MYVLLICEFLFRFKQPFGVCQWDFSKSYIWFFDEDEGNLVLTNLNCLLDERMDEIGATKGVFGFWRERVLTNCLLDERMDEIWLSTVRFFKSVLVFGGEACFDKLEDEIRFNQPRVDL